MHRVQFGTASKQLVCGILNFSLSVTDVYKFCGVPFCYFVEFNLCNCSASLDYCSGKLLEFFRFPCLWFLGFFGHDVASLC